MAEVTQSQVEEKLASYVDPYLEKDLVSSKCIKEIGIDGDTASVKVVLGFPAGGYHDQLSGILKQLVESIHGISTANIEVSSKIAAHKVQKGVKHIENIKNIIGIMAPVSQKLNWARTA